MGACCCAGIESKPMLEPNATSSSDPTTERSAHLRPRDEIISPSPLRANDGVAVGRAQPDRAQEEAVDNVSAKELFNVTLQKFIIPVVRRGIERLLRTSLESETGLQIGLMDDSFTLCIGGAHKSEMLLGEPLIRAFCIEVSAASVVTHAAVAPEHPWRSEQQSCRKRSAKHGTTTMPAAFEGVADEVLTLDLDFDAELRLGDQIHKQVFQLRSRKRFVPDLGATFGIKFVQLRRCRTRVWWSFSEQKLMVAFRVAPKVKWEIDIRVLNMELPHWLEDQVLSLGVERMLASFDLQNPLLVPLDGQEQIDRAAATAANSAAICAHEASEQATAAARACQMASHTFAVASIKAEAAMAETPASYMLAWEAFTAAAAAAKVASETYSAVTAVAKAARRSAKRARAVSDEASSRIFDASAASGASVTKRIDVSSIHEHIVYQGRDRDDRETDRGGGADSRAAAPPIKRADTFTSLSERRDEQQARQTIAPRALTPPVTPPRAHSFSPSSSKSAFALGPVCLERARTGFSVPRTRGGGFSGKRQSEPLRNGHEPLQNGQEATKRAGPPPPSHPASVDIVDERTSAARSAPTGRRASTLGSVLPSRLFQVRRTLSASRRQRRAKSMPDP
uniref:Uncharacterized protein n=1 Tax=Calcidiscus leptoporus TaxID=127549 RepID=A0A7S0JIZ2_9EUKA|mmetsp:Transcript_6734/g.15641  ORF Transcript_6734/g.15641 Transcript_6734/m.15641 type:complete len:623 (+) Transcript_6734:116-1984(+)